MATNIPDTEVIIAKKNLPKRKQRSSQVTVENPDKKEGPIWQ